MDEVLSSMAKLPPEDDYFNYHQSLMYTENTKKNLSELYPSL